MAPRRTSACLGFLAIGALGPALGVPVDPSIVQQTSLTPASGLFNSTVGAANELPPMPLAPHEFPSSTIVADESISTSGDKTTRRDRAANGSLSQYPLVPDDRLSGEAAFRPTCCAWDANTTSYPAGDCGVKDDTRLLGFGRNLSRWEAQPGIVRVLRIRANHGSMGFFAYVLFAVNQILAAQEADPAIVPFVDFGKCVVNGHDHIASGGANLYYDETYGDNMWEQYFEPVSNFSLAQVKPPNEPGRAVKYDVRSLPSQEMWDLHMGNPKSVFAYPYGAYKDILESGFNADWSHRMRERASAAIRKYVRVKPHVSRRVEEAWRGRVGAAENTPVLGVHLRGTDKQAEIGGAIIGPAGYAEAIERWLLAHPTSSIFVATDDEHFLQQMRQQYPQRVWQTPGVLRSDKNAFLDSSMKDYYQKGEDVLVDMLMLSKCNFLLKTSSAGDALLGRNADVCMRVTACEWLRARGCVCVAACAVAACAWLHAP